MKKFTKPLMFIIALFFWSMSMWAVDVQVGSGTSTTSYLPIYSCYGYTYSQQIYLASELETGGGGVGPINKIRFYFSSGSDIAKWEDWTIYLGNTAKANFSSTSDWVAIGDLTEAFSGTITTPVAGTWLEIVLDTPFDYTGGNLVVAVDENSSGYYCSAYWNSFSAGTTRGIYYRSDGTNPDPASPPTTASGTTSTIAQVQFDMAAYVSSDPPNCAVINSPANEATDVAIDATLEWVSGGGAPLGYKLFLGEDNPPTDIVNGDDLGAVLTYDPGPLNYSTTYYWKVLAYNAIGDAESCEVWSFTTSADPTIYALPYYQSFEDVDFPPLGYANQKTAGSGTPGIWDRQTSGSSPSCSPHDGTNMIRYNCYSLSSGTTGYVATAPINVFADAFVVDFWMYRDNGYSSTADLVNVYSNTQNNTTDATLLGTIHRSRSLAPVVSADGWYEYSFPVNNTDKGIKFIIFEAVSAYGNNIFVDDITLAPPPDCVPPSSLSATEITTTSALLDWNENGEATSWNIEFGEAGFTPIEVPTNEGVDKPFLLEGLSPATSYDFYVQADCGTKALSEWIGPFTFTTLCEAYGIPFTEGFEGGDFPPLCWNNFLWDLSTYGSAHTGLEFAYSNTNGSLLTTPEIEIPEGDPYQLSFWYAAESSGYPQDMDVLVSTNGVDFTEVHNIIGAVNEDYVEVLISLESYAGQSVWIQFNGLSGAGGFAYGILVDDISIDLIPPPGTLSGVVTSFDSGDPLEGVSVVAEPGAFEVFTNVSGEYELELMPGEYAVTFSHPDYYTVEEMGVIIVSGQTTTLDAEMEEVPAPICADLIYPANNANNIYPDAILEWESPEGSPNVLGYKISLYNLALGEWVEENTDLGNVTTYTPAQPFNWGTGYIWLLIPYNNAGEAEGCVPWSFTTSFAGVIDGYVENSQTGMPVEGVDVTVVEVFPNSGYTHDLMTDVDGNWELEWETGVYNITFSKFGYFDKTVNTVSINNGQITQLNTMLDPVTPYPMPFVEDWSSGSFATQQWTKEGNWDLYNVGNPAPSALFYYDPVVYDYDLMLNSYFIDATNQSQVYLQFDLRLENEYGNDTYETLQLEVFDGSVWHVVDVFDNLFESFPWQSNTYDISDLVAGGLFQFGFRAVGENSYYIDWWGVDNILVTNSIFEVDPTSVSDVLFFNESNTYDIDLNNFGFGDIDWEAEIAPASPWATLNELSGILAPGSETLELTFDAALAGAGTHTAEITFTAWGGLFEKTVMLELKVYEETGQKIMIPEPNSWGYISTYVGMEAKATLDELFADVLEDMVILIGEDGIFWPGYSINTLIDFDTYKGYKMKMAGDASLAFLGEAVETKTASFNTGIAMIPVLSEEPVSAEAIFGGHNIEFAFGLDGSIYWPAGPVMTLTTLYPGYGYLVKFNEPTTLDFDVVPPPKGVVPNKPVSFANTTQWNDVYKTSGFHMIGITAEAAAELQADDIIGVFSSNGLCTGMINYTGNNEALAIPVFVDDITSLEVDGMAEYEPMQIKIYREGEEIIVNPVYNTDLPNHDGLFATNGYSLITSFKVGATGIVDNSTSIVVYPNPSEGMYNIDGIDESVLILVTNSQGQVILKKNINDAYQLDLTKQPNGIYFIRLTGEQTVKLVKVIKQ